MNNWSDIGQVTVREDTGAIRLYESLDDAVRAVGYQYINALRGDRLAGAHHPELPLYYRHTGDTHIFMDSHSCLEDQGNLG